MSALKTIFTMGAVGTAFTLGGMILFPIFTAIGGGAAAAAGATNASVLTSFWTPLYTDVAGNIDLVGAVEKMGSGLVAIAGSGIDVASAGISAGFNGEPILGALSDAWNAPFEHAFG